MDDIKQFAKNKNEVKTHIQTVRVFIQNIGMEFGIERCAMRVIKNGKRHDKKNGTTKSRKN